MGSSKRLGYGRNDADHERFLSPEALHQALHRQRAYADRADSGFVFARVRLKDCDAQDAADSLWNAILARAVLSRCRTSDIVGACSATQDVFGLILPDTTQEGAVVLVRAIEDTFGVEARRHIGPDTKGPELACEVYPYPTPAGAMDTEWASTPTTLERAR